VTALRDAVVILTGAAGGIGRATARTLLDRGARVLALDRDAPGLDALASTLPGVHPVVADLRDVDRFEALVEQLHAVYGRIDVLVNNAGLTVHGPFAAMTADEVDRVLDVDLRAPLLLTRAVLPRLARPGHVAFVSSMAGLQAFPTQSTYSAAKFGLRGFGAALRVELARDGIGVSTVLPGAIATDFLAAAASHDRGTTDRLAGLLRRFGTSPDRVARAICRGVERDRAVLRVGWDCWAVTIAGLLCPPLVPWVLRVVHRRRLLGDM